MHNVYGHLNAESYTNMGWIGGQMFVEWADSVLGGHQTALEYISAPKRLPMKMFNLLPVVSMCHLVRLAKGSLKFLRYVNVEAPAQL